MKSGKMIGALALSCVLSLVAGSAALATMYIHTRDGRTIRVDVNRDEVDRIEYSNSRQRDYRGSNTHSSRGIVIIRAEYGQRDRWCDATEYLRRECEGRMPCTPTIGNHMCGDPIPGVRKEAIINYRCPDGVRTTRGAEGQTMNIDCR